MPRRPLIPLLVALASCSQLLGGLDEGTARVSDAGVDDGDAPVRCQALENFAYRTPIRIDSHGVAAAGYQVQIPLSTKDLIAKSHMRADRADIAMTLSDGVTRVPHWVQSGADGEPTAVWARFDLEAQPMEAWVYYGDADAVDQSSASDTFVTGVIANPNFDRADSWIPMSGGLGESTSSNQWSATIGDGGAEVRLGLQPHPNGVITGLCQWIDAPLEVFQIIFDLELRVARHASASISFLLADYDTTIWSSNGSDLVAPAIRRGLMTAPFHGARGPLCLRAQSEGSSYSPDLIATFSHLRLRRRLETEPGVQLGEEEAPCGRGR